MVVTAKGEAKEEALMAIEDPKVVLEVEATDASGNVGKDTEVPQSRSGGGDDDHDD